MDLKLDLFTFEHCLDVTLTPFSTCNMYSSFASARNREQGICCFFFPRSARTRYSRVWPDSKHSRGKSHGGYIRASTAHKIVTCIAIAPERKYDVDGSRGTFVAINNRVSQIVSHLHVHQVPRYHRDGLKGFFWPRKLYQETMQRVQAVLRSALMGS